MPTSQQNNKSTAAADFEKTFKKLEQVIAKLERGDLSLEESVKQFEHGTELLKNCQKILAEAEQKVRVVSKKNRAFQTKKFEQDTDS